MDYWKHFEELLKDEAYINKGLNEANLLYKEIKDKEDYDIWSSICHKGYYVDINLYKDYTDENNLIYLSFYPVVDRETRTKLALWDTAGSVETSDWETIYLKVKNNKLVVDKIS